MKRTPGISVAFLRPLAELLAKLDEDPAAFLSALGVTSAMAPNTYVAADLVDRELDAIAQRRADPALALALAKVAAARPLGLFGHMVWLSGTIRDALERAVKHFGMVTQRTLLQLDIDGPLARLRAIVVSRQPPRGRILTEFPFASLALRAREVTGGVFALRAVRFTHAGEYNAKYAAVFHAPVTFGTRENELEMAATELSRKLVSADPITSEIIEAKIAQLAVPPDPFLERVRHAVRDRLDATSAVTADAIARVLGVSARTLRRHLDQRGDTLRRVIRRVRRERADELLARGKPVKEVAFALGFSEPSAFSRAYKRWTGKAPKQVTPR